MMVIDTKTKSEIRKKARLFDVVKEKVKASIHDNVRMAIDKLKAVERELLNEVEAEFAENPFADFLNGVETGTNYTDEEIKIISSSEIPQCFGPDEKAFCSLLQEIDSFKTWRKRKRINLDTVPKNLKCANTTSSTITVSWDKVDFDCYYEIELKLLSTVQDVYHSSEPEFTFCDLEPATKYTIRVRTVASQLSTQTTWSNPITVRTEPKTFGFSWKECPDDVGKNVKYSVDEKNPRIATNIGLNYCAVIGSTPLPLNRVISWNIKILKSLKNNGLGIYVGIAPSDINQNDSDDNRGWYFYCYNSTLWSGPPHNYSYKEYRPRKDKGEYVHTGDSVGVVMNTTKGELSFAVNGVNLGVAYEGIPLDKPLVPCVSIYLKGDSVELLT